MVTLGQSLLLTSGRILSPLRDWGWAFCGPAGVGGVEGAR